MGEAEVIAEQKKDTYTPYVRVYLVKGSEYTYTTNDANNIIKSVEQKQEPYKEIVNIVLDNSDETFTNLDLRGYLVYLGFGFVIDGTPDYINQPYLKVKDMVFDSSPGVLTCTLICHGIMSRMNDDKASEEYVAASDAYISDLIEDCFDASLSPYSHCTSYTTDWSGVTLGTDVNIYNPGDNFRIYGNSNRMNIIRTLLENTYVYPRPANDGKVYMIKPVTSGEVYDYEYELAGDHDFFIKKRSLKLTIPSKVVIYGGEFDEDTQAWEYNGSATESESDNLNSTSYFDTISSITSDAQANAVAAAVLANFQINKKTCTVTVPFSCTQQLYDYIKITDSRQGSSMTGNVGQIVRKWESGIFIMQISFGGWLTSRKLDEHLSSYLKDTDVSLIDKWISVNVPETYLEDGDEITFHKFSLPYGRTLLVKGYSCYDGSSASYLSIEADGEEQWTMSADTWKKLWVEEIIYVNNDVGKNDIVIEFLIKNESVYPVVSNGMILYAIS